MKGNQGASDLLQIFFKQTIGAYLSPAHKCYFAEYRGVEPQDTEFQIVERANVEFQQPSSVRLLVRPRNVAFLNQKFLRVHGYVVAGKSSNSSIKSVQGSQVSLHSLVSFLPRQICGSSETACQY